MDGGGDLETEFGMATRHPVACSFTVSLNDLNGLFFETTRISFPSTLVTVSDMMRLQCKMLIHSFAEKIARRVSPSGWRIPFRRSVLDCGSTKYHTWYLYLRLLPGTVLSFFIWRPF
jgi:hypothetical protein